MCEQEICGRRRWNVRFMCVSKRESFTLCVMHDVCVMYDVCVMTMYVSFIHHRMYVSCTMYVSYMRVMYDVCVVHTS